MKTQTIVKALRLIMFVQFLFFTCMFWGYFAVGATMTQWVETQAMLSDITSRKASKDAVNLLLCIIKESHGYTDEELGEVCN